MAHQLDSTTGRRIEREISIDAPAEAVWKALTDAEELTRWFPLEAEATPGVGGAIRMRWGDLFDDTSVIQVWEPGRHLRYTFPEGGPTPLITDYYLTGVGGSTVLRVVTSGFGDGDDWDDLYAGVSAGWDFELLGLRHYLERHPGARRAVAWLTHPYVGGGAQATWDRLTGPDGWFGRSGLPPLADGDALAVTTTDGTRLDGTVRISRPGRMLVASISSWNDALFRLEMEGHGGAWIWLATWGVPAEEVRGIQETWKRSVAQALGAEDDGG